MSTSTSPQLLRNPSSTGNSHSKQAWHSMAMCIRPVRPDRKPAKSASSASTSGRIRSASRSSRSPAADRRSGFDRRTNSSTPACSSNPLTWWDNADCVRFIRSAARASPPASWMALIVFRWRNSRCMSGS